MSLLELLLSSLRLGLRNKNIISAKGERGRESERERDTHTQKNIVKIKETSNYRQILKRNMTNFK